MGSDGSRSSFALAAASSLSLVVRRRASHRPLAGSKPPASIHQLSSPPTHGSIRSCATHGPKAQPPRPAQPRGPSKSGTIAADEACRVIIAASRAAPGLERPRPSRGETIRPGSSIYPSKTVDASMAPSQNFPQSASQVGQYVGEHNALSPRHHFV